MKKHPDYQWYFCKKNKRNYLTLGYFGGGPINCSEAFELAKEFAEICKVGVETVQIDEVLRSRRFKGFKVLYSTTPNQEPAPSANKTDDVWAWLTD